jgi:hypothetical protein
MAILLFCGGSLGATIAIVLFPALSVLLGLYLYKTSPTSYISFVWWMSFLAPGIRRIIDYRINDFAYGPWNLTSLLVILICIERFLRDLPRLLSNGRGLPFLLCSATVSYGILVSLIQANTNKVIVLTAWSWICPIAFGYYIYSNWRIYPQITQTLKKTFLWGCLVMGIYGIIQYLTAPPWDSFWLLKLMGPDSSFGRPEPLGIRVFSTMNSPQAFATVMMTGLLLILSEARSPLAMPAIAAGLLSFLLSMARAGWLSFSVGLPLLFISLKPKLQIRFLLTIILISAIVGYAASSEQFSEVISSRLESFTNLGSDESFNDRFSGYSELISSALTQVIGTGYEFKVPVKTDLIVGDGSILPMLFSFGWIGTVPYLLGVLLLLIELFQGKLESWNSVKSVSRSIALGIMAQIGLNSMFVENLGLCLWCFMCLGVASNLFNQQRHLDQLEQSVIINPIGSNL